MSLLDRVIKGSFWTTFASLGTSLLGFVLIVFLARLLDPRDFGLMQIALVFFGIVELFSRLGLDQAIIQREELSKRQLDSVFWFQLTVSGLLCGVLFVIAAPAAEYMGQPNLPPLLRVLSVMLLLDALLVVHVGILKREFGFRFLSLQKLISQAVAVIVGIGMAWWDYGVWSLVGYRLADRSLDVLMIWAGSRWVPGFRFSWESLRGLFSFGVNVTGGSILKTLRVRGLRLVIGQFIGVSALGYYSVAMDIVSSITSILTHAVNQVALPMFSKLQNQPASMRRAFHRSLRLLLLVFFPVCLGLVATAPEAVRVVLGERWQPSTLLVQIVCLGNLLYPVSLLSGKILYALGRPTVDLLLSLVGTTVLFLNAGAVLWLYGNDVYALIAALQIQFVLFGVPLTLLVLRRFLGVAIDRLIREAWLPAGAATAMFLGVVGFGGLIQPVVEPVESPLSSLVLKMLVGTLIYLGLLVVFARRDYHRIREIGRRLVSREA